MIKGGMARMLYATSLISKKGMKATISTARFCRKAPLLCMSVRASQKMHSPSQQQQHATKHRPAAHESHLCMHRGIFVKKTYGFWMCSTVLSGKWMWKGTVGAVVMTSAPCSCSRR